MNYFYSFFMKNWLPKYIFYLFLLRLLLLGRLITPIKYANAEIRPVRAEIGTIKLVNFIFMPYWQYDIQ